jgi:hypothetical protein
MFRGDQERLSSVSTIFPAVFANLLCSNRAATPVNLRKYWERSHGENSVICRYFARFRNL